MTGRRAVTRALAAIAHLVPAADRGAWRREWEAEFAAALRARRPSGRWLVARLVAAAQHALWLRTRASRHPPTTPVAGAWTDLRSDVTYALRGWRRAPGVPFTVVVTLAAGLGLAAAIFSFADGYLFRQLPFRGADRTYYLRDPNAAIASLLRATDLDVLRNSPVANFGFVEWSGADSVELVVDDRRLSVLSYSVSPGFRQTLPLPLVGGRDFTAADHVAGAPRVAWVSHRLWQREFGGDQALIGRTLRIDSFAGAGVVHIVGILGREVASFDLNNRLPDLVEPARPRRRGPITLADPLIRLPDDVTPEQATARIAAALQAGAPAADGRPRVVRLVSLDAVQLAGGRPTARVFFAGALLVLLLSAMNLVHLLLARGVARAGEIATRLAIGASRWRIVRGHLVESALLGAAGIGAGLVAGRALSGAIAARVPELPTRGRNLSLVPMLFDERVIAFVVVLGTVVAIAGGLWPAWRATRRAAPGVATPSRRAGAVSRRLARVILASELTVATAVVLGAVVAGLGIYRYLTQPLGFAYTDRVRVSLRRPEARPTAADRAAAAAAVRALPGVAAAGYDAANLDARGLEVPGAIVDARTTVAYGVSAGHRETLQLEMLAGRWFPAGEFDAGDAAVVDARFARTVWPDAPALGRALRLAGRERRIVGVVAPRRFALDRDPPATIYVPVAEGAGGAQLFVWAPHAEPARLRERITAAIGRAVPGVQASAVVLTFDDLFGRGLGEARFQAPIIAAFGVMSVGLAGIGVFGLVSFLAERRRREFGIRLALGASRGHVWWGVLSDAVYPAVIGLVAGTASAWALDKVVQSKVFGWPSAGWAAVAIVTLALLAVALTAAILPARRATRVDPAATLRAE